MTLNIHVPGHKVRTRRQAREQAAIVLVIGIGIIIFAWIFLPGYTHSPTDAMFGSIVVSLFGGMFIAYGIYLFFRSNQYPETEEEIDEEREPSK